MKKLKLLLAGVALLFGGGISVYADDVFKDVTSTYLTNADFEGSYSVHKYPRGDSNKDRAIYLPTGWTINYQSGKEWDMTALKSGDLSWSSFSSVPPLGTGGTQTYRIRFNNSYKDQRLELSQSATLPKSIYKLEASWYISRTDAGDGYIKIGDTRYNASTASSWQNFSEQFTSTGTAITFLLGAYHSATTEKFYAFDNFKIYWNLTQSLLDLIEDAEDIYVSECTLDGMKTMKTALDDANNNKTSTDAAVLEAKYNALNDALPLAVAAKSYWIAKTAAETTRDRSDYENVVGTELTALNTAINASVTNTIEWYEAQATAIDEAKSAFTSAKANYDALVAEITKAKALGIADATADGYAATSSSTSESVATSTKNLKVAEYNFVSTNYTEPLILAEGDWVASTIKTETKSEHWDDVTSSYKASDGWDASNWNCSYSQNLELPAGNYVFKVAGRRSESSAMWIEVKNGETTLGSVNDFPKATSGLGINTSGSTDFTTGEGHTYANSGNGRGWEWRFVKFTLDEKATVTVAIKGSTGLKNHWINFTSYTVLANSALNVSLYEYFKALNAATTARANATYTNVDGKEKADLLAAIAADESLDKDSKDDVDVATTALSDAIAAFTASATKTAYDNLATAISNAQAIVDANKNVGSGVFQIPTSAQSTLSEAITTASGIKSNITKTKDDASTAATTLNGAVNTYNAAELNAPDPTKKYFIKVKTAGHAKWGNAIVVSPGSTSTSNPTGYTFNASAAPAPYLANNNQSFKFSKVSGNNYVVSIDGPSGTVYLTNGDKNGSDAGHKVNQIQANSDSEKAMEFRFAPSTNNGAFVIYNTEADATIACESGGSIYTTSGNADFAIEEAVASVPITIPSDVKLATRIFPFTPVLPSGVKAYSCGTAEGDVLTLVEVAEPAANTPYILYAESGYSGDALTGYGTATTDTYSVGWLTGVYTSRAATAGNYVLQNQSGTIAFYEVDDVIPTIEAYRCYLTVPSTARVLYINFNEATVVETIKALTNGKNTIYNAAGTVVPSLQKGLNIIKTSDGTIRKVMVK